MKKTKTGQGNKRKSKNAQKVTGNFDENHNCFVQDVVV